METMTEFQLQTKLDELFSTESFLTFEAGGKVMYNSESVGVWEDLDADHMKVALFIKEDDNDMDIIRVKKDKAINTNKESKDMDSNKTDCSCLTGKGVPCKSNATFERDGKPVCGSHRKAKTVKWNNKVDKLPVPTKEQIDQAEKELVSIDQLIPAFDQGAVNNPGSTQTGVAKMREALDNSKEKVMNVTVEEASQVSENVDMDKVQRFANELYGTKYPTDNTYIKVSDNSGQALDNSRPGFIYCWSEYVGKVVKVDGEFRIIFDRGDHSEDVNISKFNKEDSKVETKDQDAPVLKADVFYCNVFSKGGKTIYYFTQKWTNVNRTRDDLVARAENALRRQQNKAVVMNVGGKWVVITKVVKDGKLVTKSVYAENMDLRQNKR